MVKNSSNIFDAFVKNIDIPQDDISSQTLVESWMNIVNTIVDEGDGTILFLNFTQVIEWLDSKADGSIGSIQILNGYYYALKHLKESTSKMIVWKYGHAEINYGRVMPSKDIFNNWVIFGVVLIVNIKFDDSFKMEDRFTHAIGLFLSEDMESATLYDPNHGKISWPTFKNEEDDNFIKAVGVLRKKCKDTSFIEIIKSMFNTDPDMPHDTVAIHSLFLAEPDYARTMCNDSLNIQRNIEACT